MSELPRGWVEGRLAEVCELITDGTHHSPSNGAVGEFKYVTAKNIRKHGLDLKNITYVDAATHREIYTRCPVKVGDVLYIKDGATTGIAIVNPLEEEFSMLSSVALLRPLGPLLDSHFLSQQLNSRSLRDRMTGDMTGSAIRRLTLTTIGRQEVIVPPLAEQKRIMAKLDALNAKSVRARTELARIETLVLRYKQVLLSKAFSGELTASFRVQEGLSAWTREPAEDVCEKVQSGGTPKSGFSSDGIPFLKVYNIVSQLVSFDYRPQFVAEEIHRKELKRSTVLPGDVLMNIVGPPLGKVAIVPDSNPEWNINQAITFFRPSKRVTTKWIYYFLCSGASVSSVENETKGSAGQVNISLSQCRAFVFPVPAIKEQNEVVRRIESAFAKIDRLAAEAKRALGLVSSLDEAILAKAFRGELVPQDKNDRPASALLERIRAERDSTPKAMTKRTKRVTAIPTAADFLNTKLENWPPKGATTFDELKRDFSGSYEDLREALFEFLSGAKPRLEQVFDEKAAVMMIRKR